MLILEYNNDTVEMMHDYLTKYNECDHLFEKKQGLIDEVMQNEMNTIRCNKINTIK